MKAFKIKHIHFVGIGGIGMSGMAEVLLNQGYIVSGSDRQLSDVTDRLSSLGATIYEGHAESNVAGADVVVYSSAVQADNEELVGAVKQGIPTIKRAEMLAELMRMKYGIAVAGTHGKTTTTSMVGSVVTEGGLKPTVIIGGIVKAFASNAVLGESDYMVAEADEYDKSFLRLNPTIAVITNIEPEHLECYDNSFQDLKEAFIEFANKIPFYGNVLLCLDERFNQEILPDLKWNVITYGFLPHADLQIYDFQQKGLKSVFKIRYKDEQLGQFTLHIPGVHNVKNAAAAIGVGKILDIPVAKIKRAISAFTGVYRRFELKYEEHGITVIDDYAHHPSEIQNTLKTARNVHGDGKIIAIFQPHLYSRTQRFLSEFAHSFFEVDELIVTDIYPAREKPIPGITSELLVEEIVKIGHKNCTYLSDFNEIRDYLKNHISEGDMVITLGAGSINKLSNMIKETLEKK
ncbi:MAG: UDP-N-acetylmuramate--L-alanine ligase [Calditrichia bacterium]